MHIIGQKFHLNLHVYEMLFVISRITKLGRTSRHSDVDCWIHPGRFEHLTLPTIWPKQEKFYRFLGVWLQSLQQCSGQSAWETVDRQPEL